MRALILASLLASASTLAMASADPDLLVGQWQCDFAERSDDMTMEMTSQVTYAADRSANFDMVLDIDIPAMGQALKIGMIGDGSWQLDGDQLLVTTNSFDVENLGEPGPFADMMIGQFESEDMVGVESRSTIVELTSSRLVEQPEDGGPTTTCTR
ncbi:MAG: hypothetical protein LAT65_13155 [Saccharospirillum sp.]|nr:hypothetical protein [Saccharospirillum sp.]